VEGKSARAHRTGKSTLLVRSVRPGSRLRRLIRLQSVVIAVFALENVTIDRLEHFIEKAVYGFPDEVAEVGPLPRHDV